MKCSFVLFLSFLSSLLSFAQSQVNDALYIYRNDGKFNAFFYSEIDSITTSKLDELGNVYDEYKSQVVWTQDSVYWIPLEAIDSVSLCKPQNKYSSRVRKIDELLPYITAVNGMTLNLTSLTPSNLIPAKGDILLYDSLVDERFPSGFVGRVEDVESLKVICDSVSFEDVYDEFTCFGKYMVMDEPDENGYSRRRFAPKKINATISPSLNISGTLRSDTTSTGDTEGFYYVTINGHLALDISLLYRHSKGSSPYMDVSIHPCAKINVEAGLMGKLPPKELYIPLFWIRIPIPDSPFFVAVVGGPSLKATAEASVSFSTEGELGFECGFKYENGKLNTDGHNYNTSKGFSKPTLSGNISGSLFGGLRVGVALCTIGEILGVSTENEGGVEVVANFSSDILSLPYSSIYEELQKVNVDFNLLASLGASAGLKFGKKLELKKSVQLASIKSKIMSRKIVPSFTTPSIEKLESTKITTSVTPNERLLWPIPIGLGICNQNGDFIDTKYCDNSYRLPESWPLDKYMETFDNLTPGSVYEVCPMIKFMGIPIKALPSTQLVTKFPTPAKVKKFEVNNATFVRDGFEYKDKTYYYDFAATTTVELEDSEGVEDWGYVYKDPEGEKVHISVKDLGTNADSRYDYYRTIPKSKATLYGYVKYGEDKYAYEEPKDYPLEYTFHPTAYVDDVIADSITATSAQFEYGFDDVPRTGKCFVAYQSVKDEEPIIREVSYTEKDTIKVADLYPETTYDYWAYVVYAGETYRDLEGKKSFTTLTPSAYVEKADEEKITTTSAQVVYGFKNVPENAKCFITIRSKIDGTSETGEETHSSYSQNYSVSNTEKGTYEFTGLNPSTTYTYFAYIEYEEDLWSSDIESFKTKTPPPPVATTGDCSNVTTNSAIVSCTFENVPDDGVCGVVYKWDDEEFSKKTANNANGIQTITLSGLKSGTTYTYNAFVEANGQTYYGGEKTFTTQVELPDLSGTWSCTIYKDDGSILDTPSITLTSDGKATQQGSSFTSEDKVGSWNVDTNGKVGISFSWAGASQYNPVWFGETFGGTVNNLSSPSSIEGSVYRGWAGLSEHGKSYKFKMTR